MLQTKSHNWVFITLPSLTHQLINVRYDEHRYDKIKRTFIQYRLKIGVCIPTSSWTQIYVHHFPNIRTSAEFKGNVVAQNKYYIFSLEAFKWQNLKSRNAHTLLRKRHASETVVYTGHQLMCKRGETHRDIQLLIVGSLKIKPLRVMTSKLSEEVLTLLAAWTSLEIKSFGWRGRDILKTKYSVEGAEEKN